MEYDGLNEVLKNINASVVVYKVDEDSNIHLEYYNDRFAQIYGGDSEALREELKRDITFGVADEYKMLVRDMFLKAVSSGETGEATYRAVTKESQDIWVNAKVSPVKREHDSLVYITFFNVTKQVVATEKARRSERYLQSACEFANIFSWVYEVDTKVIHTGKLLQEQIGLPESMENFPECIFELHMVNPEYEELYRSKISALEKGENKVEFEVRADLPDGLTHWISYRFDIVEYDENQKPKIAVGTAQFSDVNKRLEARYSLEQKRKIVDDPSMLGYVVSNINTNHVLERKNLHKKMQFSDGEECYTKVAQEFSKTIVSSEERKKWLKTHDVKNMMSLFRSGTTAVDLQANVICRDGIMRWVREVMNFVQHPDTGEVLLYNYFYDNHNQHVFGELMKAMADYGYELCGSLVANLDQFSLIYAGDSNHKMIIGSYTQMNDNYSKIVMDEDLEMYKKMTAIEHMPEEIKEENNGYEITYRTIEDGEVHYKRAQCYLYNMEEQTYLIMRSDVTVAVKKEAEKRKQLEKALEETKRANLAKSKFLSRMSHELRTPLNAINGYTTLIETELNDGIIDSNTIRNNIEMTHNATDYLLNIISDILDIQSIEQGRTIIHKQEVVIEKYIENVASMIQNEVEEKNIDFLLEHKTHLNKSYMIDGPRFQQILLNVLHNAVKFTPENGKITMSGESIMQKDGKCLFRIAIKDNGIGMSREFLENGLFQKFAQENNDITSPYDGCGTGLFLSKELIQLMDGDITCISEQGSGSEFVISLLTEPVKSYRRERRKREEFTADLSGVRILLCEDNPMNQDMEMKLLKRMKCEVDIADDGQIGLDKFKESPEKYYDMVLMDIRMPNMDGLQTTREIRALERKDVKEIPIIAVSANAFEEDVEKSLEAGMNEHLAKPVNARILCEKIKEYCKIVVQK